MMCFRFALPLWSNAFSDDLSGPRSGNFWFYNNQTAVTGGQILLAITIIVAVTVCDSCTSLLSPSLISSNIYYTISSDSIRRWNAVLKKDSIKNRRQIIIGVIGDYRWSTLSLELFIYNQQVKDVVVIQYNQHHREKHRRSSTLFSTLYIKMANNNGISYPLNVVEFNFIVRIAISKMVLVDNIIFSYLISLDLYS